MDFKFKSSFMQDFSIANMFGEKAVRDTYSRAFKEWHSDVEYITEFTIALNYWIWLLYEKDEQLAKVYDELWRKADAWCMDNLKGDDLSYYLRTTD
jgi:hypothetical protein